MHGPRDECMPGNRVNLAHPFVYFPPRKCQGMESANSVPIISCITVLWETNPGFLRKELLLDHRHG